MMHIFYENLDCFLISNNWALSIIRLTDDSVTRLIKNCSKVKTIGGICEWKTRDLLSLLQNLMLEEGWKITLESQPSVVH